MESDLVTVEHVIEPASDVPAALSLETTDNEDTTCESGGCPAEKPKEGLEPSPTVPSSDSDSEHDQDMNDAFCSVCKNLEGGRFGGPVGSVDPSLVH
jgi:hypothetical protein